MTLKTDDIIDTYFKGNNKLVEHQIEFYNYFVDDILPQIISQYFPVSVPFNDDSNCVIKNIELNVKNMKVGKTTID